jgi:Ankyrin repeats (3 copies)
MSTEAHPLSATGPTLNLKKKSRTIQVKEGNTIRTLSPDEAANYLKSIKAVNGGFTRMSTTVINGKGSIARQLKMTFDTGPSNSTVSLPQNGPTMGSASMKHSAVAMQMPSMPLSASDCDVFNAGQSSMRSMPSTRPDGMPCSEKEMKALMSMFVEIMGLQMNTDRLNQVKPATSSSMKKRASKNTKSVASSTNVSPVFRFPADVPPPPRGWPESLSWPPVADVDDDDSVDSLPPLESIPFEERPKMIRYAQESMRRALRKCKSVTPIPPVPGTPNGQQPCDVAGPVTGVAGIVPFEWTAIERSAIEGALEQEELGIRFRFASDYMSSNQNDSKTKKSSTPSVQQNSLHQTPNFSSTTRSASVTSHEAAVALQKVEEANKKLSKAVLMWRNRVVTAVTQNEIAKLELLLSESPLRTVTHMQEQAASVLSFHNNNNTKKSMDRNRSQLMVNNYIGGSESVDDHLKFLVPLTVPKNFAGIKDNFESRLLLALYIIQEFSPTHFLSPGRNGRSVLHTVCMMGDIPILKLILDRASESLNSAIVYDAILRKCQDSGWNSLHYAVSSGSLRAVEYLLQALNGENSRLHDAIQSVSNDTLTWKRGEPQQGITVQHLAVALMSYQPETMIETHGMALQEIVSYRLRNKTPCVEPDFYVTMLSQISIHLVILQSMGYNPLDEDDILRVERDTVVYMEQCRQKKLNFFDHNFFVSPSGDDEQWMDSDEEASQTAKLDKKKKKKKKRKNKTSVAVASAVSVTTSNDAVSDNAVDVPILDKDDSSVAESEVSRSPPTTTTADPLVTALLGMGLEYSSIMDGIEACGGISRATADDVVAWIFGGGSEPSSNDEHMEKDKQLQSDTPLISPTSSKKVNEKHNMEVIRLQEEERVAAEKLALKREEQRRRNREWNNRAQARQIQEIQEKLAKTTVLARPQGSSVGGGTRHGLVPASDHLIGNAASVARGTSPTLFLASLGQDASTATPSRMVAPVSNRMVGRLNLGPSAADSGLDNAYSNDGSTIASSVDHGIIEIGGNDDATVSTIGSFPAVCPSVTTSHAPPGFSHGPLLSSTEGQMPQRGITQAQWEAHRLLSINDAYPMNSAAYSQDDVGMMGLDSIAPQSDQLQNHHGNYYAGFQSQSLNLPTHANGLPRTVGSFSAASADFAPGGSSLFGSGSTTLVRNDGGIQYGSEGMGASLLSSGYHMQPLQSNLMERSISAPSHLQSSFMNDSSHRMPDLFGLGPEINQKAIDSSIIDSISTGNAGIGGSALWDGTPDAHNGGSSLLRNLISNSSLDRQGESSLFSNEADSHFPSTHFLSNDGVSWEQETLNKLHSSQEGTMGSSIW